MFKVTTIHPLALGFTVMMGIAVLLLPRRYALIPFLLVGILVPEMQRIVVLAFDFTMLRLFLLIAFVRIVLRSEYTGITHSRIDTAVIAFALLGFLTYTILRASTAATVNRLGAVYNTLGTYFFIRCIVRDMDDILVGLSTLTFVCICFAISMAIEQRTGSNFFSIFGGVSAITQVREGKLRSQGAFPHPLLAGAYGATLIPTLYWMYRNGRKRIAGLGLLASAVVTISASSSGPLSAFFAGIAGLFFWTVRYSVRSVRWGFVLMLLGLSVIMKAPVYAIVTRFAFFGGSTGYHRYALIDQAVRRFGEWWLLGTESTAHWGWGLWDVTNQYIAVGVDGGIFLLLVFVAMITLAFRNVGIAVRSQASDPVKYLLWACGATLFAHTVAFMGMTYFGSQIYMSWWFLIAVFALAPRLVENASGRKPALRQT